MSGRLVVDTRGCTSEISLVVRETVVYTQSVRASSVPEVVEAVQIALSRMPRAISLAEGVVLLGGSRELQAMLEEATGPRVVLDNRQ
jgi:hypothetical protein